MKHYLVTGGAGFIGSNLISNLLAEVKDVRISCLDNFDPFYPVELKNQNILSFKNDPRFKLIQADLATITVQQLREAIPEKIDVIIHLAAKAGVRPSIENPVAYQQTNVMGLQTLLEFAKDNHITQFVFASSSSVYGVNDHFPWSEDEQLMPISPYAMTKLSGEMLGHVYSKLYGIRFIALRFFTVYGPGQRPDLAIHKFTKAILQNKPITMYGDGNTSRDYTYVEDIVQGIKAAIDYEKSLFEIINLGNHYSIPLKELVQLIEEVTGKKAIIQSLPEQAGDVPKTYADIEKAQRLLNYHPATSIKEGLEKFHQWYLHHPILSRELLATP